jgi:hypothetical protein
MHYLGDFITKKYIGRHVRYTSIYDGNIYLTYFFWNILDIFYHKRASTWLSKAVNHANSEKKFWGVVMLMC